LKDLYIEVISHHYQRVKILCDIMFSDYTAVFNLKL